MRIKYKPNDKLIEVVIILIIIFLIGGLIGRTV